MSLEVVLPFRPDVICSKWRTEKRVERGALGIEAEGGCKSRYSMFTIAHSVCASGDTGAKCILAGIRHLVSHVQPCHTEIAKIPLAGVEVSSWRIRSFAALGAAPGHATESEHERSATAALHER